MTIGILSEKCNLPKTEFLIAVRLILDFTYFVFDNIIYKQNFDMLMDSSLSSIIADLVMQRLGRTTLSLFNDQGSFFYFRYVNDLCAAVSSSEVLTFWNVFNLFHPHLQLTLKIGENSLNFLNVQIMINNLVIFDWYHKSSF